VTPRGFADATGERTLQVDVVVVGSGPGGSAVSRALAERGAKVLVLEEGPPKPRFRPSMPHTQRYHMQEGGLIVARGSGFMPIAAGRGVGGGSLINSAICFRTPDHVLDGWAEVLGGDARFAPAAMAPVFDELEALLGIGTTPDEVLGENNRIIIRGARALGLPGGAVRRNAPGCAGCGLCNHGCPIGGKASVDRVLLPIAAAHGAIIQGDARVTRVIVEGGRAVGVEARIHDTDSLEVVGALTVRAGTVVLAAGAIGTPRLLWSSGLGDLGPVGDGLHVHPGNAVLGLCDHEVVMWRGATQGAWFEDPALPGVLPHTLSLPPGPALLMLGPSGAAAKASHELLPNLCGCVVMISDHGTGRVRATADGRADVTYTFEPNDVQRIKDGMRTTASVLMAGGAREVMAPVHGLGRYTDVDAFTAALATRDVTDFTLYASHPMSTCRMGADPSRAVIGPTGEAHRLPGLVIADASVFPTSLGVNPQLTTMAVATMIGRALPL
jgi:choline dehydrogenase-like flavoprotein